MSESPLYKHDCSQCEFLGSHRFMEDDYDLYFCLRDGFPTLLARWSDDGPDYLSGFSFGEHMALSDERDEQQHPMAEAYFRYKARKEQKGVTSMTVGPAMTTLAQTWADRAEALDTASRIVPLIEDIHRMAERARDTELYQALLVIEGQLHRANVALLRLVVEEV